MAVDTTFLPKTNGMVFADRLVARAQKGRVFLLDVPGDIPVEPPPSMEPVSVTVNGIEYDYNVGAFLTVLLNDPLPVVVTASGGSPTYQWSTRRGSATYAPEDSATTEITCTSEGSVSCMCVLTDNDTLEDQISFLINFYVVDAL